MDTLIITRQEAEEDPTETNLENLSQAHLIQTVSDIFFGRCHGLLVNIQSKATIGPPGIPVGQWWLLSYVYWGTFKTYF